MAKKRRICFIDDDHDELTRAANVLSQRFILGKRDDPQPTWEQFDARHHQAITEQLEKRFGKPIPAAQSFVSPSEILAPGATIGGISTPVMLYDQEGIKLLQTITRYFLVRVTYKDIFGKTRHTTKMCFMYSSLDVIAKCPTGNWMD